MKLSIVLLAAALAAFWLLFRALRFNRRRNMEEAKQRTAYFGNMAQAILQKSLAEVELARGSRQASFVHSVVGDQQGSLSVWARVSATAKTVSVVVQCSPESNETDRRIATSLYDALRDRIAFRATIQFGALQPKPSEQLSTALVKA